MQIVIELSDEIYKDIKEENSIYGINNGLSARITGKVVGAIQNGKPLPKGRGRLIDADSMKTMKNIQSANFNAVELIRLWIDKQPTIIESDRAESEGKKEA